ncbi:MAG: ABC transporter ATP-binding protein [Bacteroidales bacterium]
MITVTNLSFSYRGSTVNAVNDLSFSVKEGEIFGFLGPSGAGKSTTQKLLTRLLRGYSGTITIGGRPLNVWDNTFYSYIGVGFELPNHYLKLTALENLELFGSFYPSRIISPAKMLEMVDLGDHARKRVGDFSKGMKMRLSFVRALMHDPPVLFFDEPTSGLDPGYARVLKDIIISKRREGKTIFLTTHNMHDAAELCDRVAFMVDGSLNLTGSPRELTMLNSRRKIEITSREGKSIHTRTFEIGNLAANREFLEAIDNPQLISLHSCEETLEDVFLRTTGRKLINNS